MDDVSAERWLPVVDFEGYYEVSDLGRIRRIRPGRGKAVAGRMMRQVRTPKGRLQVVLCGGSRDKIKTFLVHRLVVEAFAGPAPGQHEVNHINGDPSDNRLVNLEWVTHSQNMLHAVANGLWMPAGGEMPSTVRLTSEQVLAVRQTPLRSSGRTHAGHRYVISNAEWARRLGVSVSVIKKIRAGKTWRPVGRQI